jgi:hypothetical protein
VKLTSNAQTAAGVALIVAGAYVIREAWEGRGRHRPFLLRFLPG